MTNLLLLLILLELSGHGKYIRKKLSYYRVPFYIGIAVGVVTWLIM